MYSVFIPFLSRSKSIQRCLNALHENSVYKHEIVCTIGENDVYYAFNEGVYKCKYDTVVFLNDDMIVGPGWDKYIPEYSSPDILLTMYVYEPKSGGMFVGPSPIVKSFGGIDNFDQEGFNRFTIEQSSVTPDFIPNTSGWYMPTVVNKKTFVGFPNVIKFPYCANDFLLFNMLQYAEHDYKFGVINGHIYHFGHSSIDTM